MGRCRTAGSRRRFPDPVDTDRADRPLPDQVVIARARRTAASARGRAALRQRGATVERSFEHVLDEGGGGARHSAGRRISRSDTSCRRRAPTRAPAFEASAFPGHCGKPGPLVVAFVLDCLLMRLLRSSALTFRIGLAQHIFRGRLPCAVCLSPSHRSESPIFRQSPRCPDGRRRAPRRSHDRIQDGWVACHDRRRRTPGARREVRNAPGFRA